ncbi:Mn2+ and Fe2+ transporters of the NRAMP family [Cyclobacterium xiamenense]|uniref:Mn2+ and Fe2+ transporters of the NRAMP family n=1 Tax=Cyclobacterium xiamenense TaxID=1297121 RepID=A0A1H7ARS0_9BACT|nr:divalent metal cation transporter [Cyclobacterium xiamenense]SEJ68018.1 Mn2+ and Fe2+ transporters of the NRAMP family [Cyclobacterium xiamenense]
MKSRAFFKTLGPGILFASTAIGVSHLVQSTRAGAEFGFALVGFILAANLFKWPTFEFGSRYASATGRSLIDGYQLLHPGYLKMYLGINLLSMFFVNAAVTYVAAGFLQFLFGIEVPATYYYLPSLVLLAFTFFFLALGRYALLDAGIKVIGTFMLLSTLLAFFIALFNGPEKPLVIQPLAEIISPATLPFIIALMGWMPSAIDSSTWNSLWTTERIKHSGYRPTVKETVFEFNLGYWVSAALSICFVVLGAFLLYGTERVLPNNNVGFASGVVSLYAANLGAWTFPIIAAAGFTIMLGTCIGVMDGYARSTARAVAILRNKPESRRQYLFWIGLIGLGGFVTIRFFMTSFTELINLATIISFLIAPIIAFLNYRLVFSEHLSTSQRPGRITHVISLMGIGFLTLFSLGMGGYYLFY